MEASISDPARDVLRAMDLFDTGDGNTFAQRLSNVGKVAPWSPEFYHLIKLMQDNITSVQSLLLMEEGVDKEDEAHISQSIDLILGAFMPDCLIQNYTEAIKPNASFGSNSRTFLRSSSRTIRRFESFENVSASDIGIIESAISNIRNDMKDLQLEKADFARDALVRGCNEISFILARINILGYSRIRAPAIDLGAFIYAISRELEETNSQVKIVKSVHSFKEMYNRIYEMYKAASMLKLGYEGASWMLTRLAGV
ncbi:hypothetical protein NSE01_02910 [Novosphingobium sediminis]|uniref:Uncharacterized protein n=2 Tax=Novosphingobium sediminis TaxID=707214 RepID=A0A512AFI2_9SPHN|nr:hypothetical protein NSE01_02910 [Novosphingobium sediminis]